MKYMTFNSSCSYAGLANMLEQYGVDTDDRTIALAMKLPYLFAAEDGVYMSGPMLQSARWFDLYLGTIGFCMDEAKLPAAGAAEFLTGQKTAMLGMYIGRNAKHAVVYTGRREDRLIFLNNKWEHSDEPARLELTEAELSGRLDSSVVIATLKQAQVSQPNYGQLLTGSCDVLQGLRRDIGQFCARSRSHQAIVGAMNTLFRAILLDGITMLGLIGSEPLACRLKAVQTELLAVVRSGEPATLSEKINTAALDRAIEEYIALIEEQLCQLK